VAEEADDAVLPPLDYLNKLTRHLLNISMAGHHVAFFDYGPIVNM
jgi:hypothetical protein